MKAAVRAIVSAHRRRRDHFGRQSTELPPLELCATDSEWKAGTPGGVSASAPEHEWTRALTGRRSSRQVRVCDWTDDPTPYLDLLSPFGPLRETDVIE